ncbi:MAG: adenosylmethionine decarboxylase [Candidatus Aenigmarchaeota archaeon]|nr:adenosylmethionine decarboxylase [Candidatus Aenigmarchaeota archaeon]
MVFGPHLTLDIYGCSREALKDADFIYEILDELPDLIGMTKISKPSVSYYDGNPDSFDKGGVSGFVIIAESHISIHTFVEQQFASVDIFSCKEFDIEKSVEYLSGKLGGKKVEKNLIMRGTEFPKDLKVAKPIFEKQRKMLKR